ncbi:MAG: metallophosphoesterase family protein [Minisyncoccota bacterium]
MKPVFTIAAVSDIHVNKYPLQKDFFNRVNNNANLLIIGGDMNNGKKEEVEHFLDLVSGVRIPMTVVFGNHDCDTDNIEGIKEMLLKNPLIKILDGEYVEYELNEKRLGIAGTKGFGGGFAPHRLVSRGEQATKSFVEEENREVTRLETALNRMKVAAPDFKIALTHWAAFEETIEGEPKELYPFLGSSRLGDLIESAVPHLALSGHAHHGSSGIKKARGKISACNVAYKANNGKISLFDVFSGGIVEQRYLESH